MKALLDKELEIKTLEIKKVFDLISEKENIEFKNDEIYEQKTPIKIQDENGDWVNVVGLMTKEANIYRVTFDDGEIIEAADRHLLFTENVCAFVNELTEGMRVVDSEGKQRIVVSVENLDKVETVYDLSIDTESHLYQTANKLIHHNTFRAREALAAAEKELKSRGSGYVEKGGTVSAFEMYKFMFENNGKILMFDDLKGPLDDSTGIEVLKKALDSNDPRTVEYDKAHPDLSSPKRIKRLERDIKKIEGKLEKAENAESPNSDTIDRLGDRLEDFQDLLEEERAKPPKKFIFNGRIIFITNKKVSDIDTALTSRLMTIDVDFSPDQVIELIQSQITKFLPNVSMSIKNATLNYLIELHKQGKIPGKIDFRKVENAITIWVCTEVPVDERKQWIRQAFRQMR